MIRSSYNYVDFDTVFFVGALGIDNSDTSIKKPGFNAKHGPRHSHPSINSVKSDVRTAFVTSGSSEGDNEMSSSSDATVAVTMRATSAAYQPADAKKRLSKIPVPGALGPPKALGLQRANSLGSRSAPSSGSTTPVPPENRVVYRNKASRQGADKITSSNRHSYNENFRSLPTSASTSPASKHKSGTMSSNSSSSSLTSSSGATKPHSNIGIKKAHNGRLPISKTSSASTPEEVKKAYEKNRQADVFSKPSGNRQHFGMQRSSATSSRSQSQSSSRSESPNDLSPYGLPQRRSTMPSRRPTTKQQVSKETSALSRLASRITQWAQRSQNDPEPHTSIKRPQTNKPSTRSQEIPVRKTPSPYDRTSRPNVPVRRSSFKLKGSRGSISSTGSVSPIDVHTDDTTSYQHSDRDTESPFFDTETPIAPTSPLLMETPVRGGDEASSFESSTAYVDTSSSSMNSNTATPIVTKRTPKDHHSPYFKRMAGTSSKSSELGQLIGELNLEEIEGAVSMEADEYRRMAQEVKALKTVLLKLKRELQADVS